MEVIAPKGKLSLGVATAEGAQCHQERTRSFENAVATALI